MPETRIEILIIGEGGDGIKALGKILATAAFLENYKIGSKCDYTPAARGGECIASIVMSDKDLLYPLVEEADYCFSMHNEFLNSKLVKDKITEKTTIVSIDPVISENLPANIKPEKILIFEKPGKERANMFMLKVIQKTIGIISAENIKKATEEIFGKKKR